MYSEITPIDPIPVAVQSGKDLADGFVLWMKNSIPALVNPVKALTREMDAEALRTYASRVMESDCTKVYPIAAGVFNNVYLLGFRDGREVILRVQRFEEDLQVRDQTLLRDRVLSEAATLRYIKTHLSVPVPTVYDVNDQASNPVGGRFIIEERVLGRKVPFRKCTPDQCKAMLTQVFRYEAELMSAHFNAIGSIYHRAEDNTFYVGPMVPSVCYIIHHTVDRGPWTSTRDWFKAAIKSELARMQDDPEMYRELRLGKYREVDDDLPFAYYVAFLETLLKMIGKLRYLRSIPAEVERPVLFHEDLSSENLLFSYPDPNVLAGIIDFEGACVIPLWRAMANPLCFMEIENTDPLAKLRLEILCQADPACDEACSYHKSLRFLYNLIFGGTTSTRSVEEMHETYQRMKDWWPVREPAFKALDELVALGPSGYVSS